MRYTGWDVRRQDEPQGHPGDFTESYAWQLSKPRCSARHVVGVQYILIKRITLNKPKVWEGRDMECGLRVYTVDFSLLSTGVSWRSLKRRAQAQICWVCGWYAWHRRWGGRKWTCWMRPLLVTPKAGTGWRRGACLAGDEEREVPVPLAHGIWCSLELLWLLSLFWCIYLYPTF